MAVVSGMHENVYIDTSAYSTLGLVEQLVPFMKAHVGARKVLSSNDYPMIAHSHAMDELSQLGLCGHTRSEYLYANARVFAKPGRVAG
jgi:predicted TIM-barrel fold metal-dependent hydrolase